MEKLIDHYCKTVKVGDRFGRLVVQRTCRPENSYRYKAVCLCDCGKSSVVRIDSLRSGVQTSCGCYHAEIIRKHGCRSAPLYTVWRHMIERCENPDDKAFHHYGGRGITVCDEWHDVAVFVRDMSAGYVKGLSIDRIDNNGPYHPTNCQWSTKKEQADNRRTTTQVEFNGKIQSILKWSEETGISYGTLWDRIQLSGWSPEKALTTPVYSAEERMAVARAARLSRSSQE